MARNPLRIPLIFFIAMGFWWGGVSRADASSFDVSLFTGISSLLKLGDSYTKVTQGLHYSFKPLKLVESPEMARLKIEQAIFYPELGLRVYFRRNGAILITLQEPFKGTIRTKNISLFPFGPCPTGDWESFLIKELGNPEFKMTGGKFNSQGLFYSWGDISFNKMGPNELALYRDPLVTKYREKNFGRELTVSPNLE
ncbi:MAG: hypothetical protein EB078_03160 [Proteobacteria bacterium]|nr:hypothetical protein [Pseudomonadota bacterium]NDD03881.1 hypothetical protein [Pseudomonadota bacterium]NDG26410.1 hypothetical protein [Pseudomonadota bacterium]